MADNDSNQTVGSDVAEAFVPDVEKSGKLIDFTKDYERLRKQKNRDIASIESRILTNLAMVLGEQWIGTRHRTIFTRSRSPNKLHLVFNLIARSLHKTLGRLFSIANVFKAVPSKDTASAKSHAKVVDKLIKALDQKLGQPTRTWELAWWMAVGGVAFEHIPWVPDATLEPMPVFDDNDELIWVHKLTGQEVPNSVYEELVASGTPPEAYDPKEELLPAGDVGSEILNPLQVFIDATARDVESLPPDLPVYIAHIRTLGWIEENYDITPATRDAIHGNTDVKIIKTGFELRGAPTGGISLHDVVPSLSGSIGDDDPPMAVVVERYQNPDKRHPRGRYSVFIPDVAVLLDGPNPYEEIPLVDFHWTPATTTFWTSDYITDMIAPQRFINKRISQLGEQANASLYANDLLGAPLTSADIPADYPAPIENALNENGVPRIQRRQPPELPSWFMPSIEFVLRMFKETSGGPDLFDENKFPGQLRGPMAVPMLQELSDSQWGHLYEHIGERMARVKQMRMNRVKQFYPPFRTLHYTSPSERDEVFDFHTKQILRAGVEYRITVERSSLLPELRAMREARVMERLSGPLAGLYFDPRIGSIDYSKVAADLHFGDVEREGREAQYRKLAGELVEKIWRTEPLPENIPMPFWDHRVIMDELEAVMATGEWLSASPPVQQAFIDLWNKSREFMAQAAQQQQESLQSAQMQSAVAQATQQAAAKAAAMAVDAALGTAQASQQTDPNAQQDLARAFSEQERQ